MKRIAIIFATSAAVLVSGCSGVVPPTTFTTTPTTTPITSPTTTPITTPITTTTTTPPTTSNPQITGNWQFKATSITSGVVPFTIAGSVSQASSTGSGSGVLSGASYVNGSSCFDAMTPRSLTGTMSSGNASLTLSGTDGQVVTLSGGFTVSALSGLPGFTGTYRIDGGCGNGDTGTVTGIGVYIDQALDGTFTTSGQQTFNVSGGLYQGLPNSDGSSVISGTVTLGSPCFTSVTIKPGTLSSGSFIMGTAVGLEFDTTNGTITFAGTVDLSSYDPEFDSYMISGKYTVSGGTCDGTGTAVLRVYNPWDY